MFTGREMGGLYLSDTLPGAVQVLLHFAEHLQAGEGVIDFGVRSGHEVVGVGSGAGVTDSLGFLDAIEGERAFGGQLVDDGLFVGGHGCWFTCLDSS